MLQAAGLGHTEIVEYILGRCKKTVSIQDHEGRTPLHYAAALKDDGEIYTLLKESVADEETLDKVIHNTYRFTLHLTPYLLCIVLILFYIQGFCHFLCYFTGMFVITLLVELTL